MRAIMVCVDYSDLLAITLPYNRHHFERVMVVTNCDPVGLVKVERVTAPLGVEVFCTNAFYRNGATFNKWAALEEGLDAMGREGWICLMDADVLWPRNVHVGEIIRGTLSVGVLNGTKVSDLVIQPGHLCTPPRRMWNEWPNYPEVLRQYKTIADGHHVPPEELWDRFPIHRNVAEWAGYSQIFHADDPVLGPPPWHEVDWSHAGGADSMFQRKWPQDRKVRPPFEVLHLGSAGQNWMGRATPLADGTLLPGSAERARMSGRTIWERRRQNRAEGRDQFDGEKLK